MELLITPDSVPTLAGCFVKCWSFLSQWYNLLTFWAHFNFGQYVSRIKLFFRCNVTEVKLIICVYNVSQRLVRMLGVPQVFQLGCTWGGCLHCSHRWHRCDWWSQLLDSVGLCVSCRISMDGLMICLISVKHMDSFSFSLSPRYCTGPFAGRLKSNEN